MNGNLKRVAVYASLGADLTHYEVDVDAATLTRRSTVRLPASVQYCWPHVSKKYFYATSSDGGPAASGGASGSQHHLSAFRIDPESGALEPHGTPVRLQHRPIHMTLDITSRHALVAYSDPSGLSIHRINPDGTLGDEVQQTLRIDTGTYPHQIRVTPANDMVILVTRGHHITPGKAKAPGALKVFQYRDGVLSDEVSIAPDGGHAFGPRHLDFHPSKPWIYMSLEAQNKLCMFSIDGNKLSATPHFCKDTLVDPVNVGSRQLTSTVHVHPNGRYVYTAERGDNEVEVDGQRVFSGGENTLLAYSIDQSSGEPALIDRIYTRGLHPRTFAIDPSGRLLVAANKSTVPVKDASGVHTVSACMDLFRIGADGKLDFVRKYDIDASKVPMFWMGMIGLHKDC